MGGCITEFGLSSRDGVGDTSGLCTLQYLLHVGSYPSCPAFPMLSMELFSLPDQHLSSGNFFDPNAAAEASCGTEILHPVWVEAP